MKWIKKNLPSILSRLSMAAFTITVLYLLGLLSITFGVTDFGLDITSTNGLNTVALMLSFSTIFLLTTLYLFWKILESMKQNLPFRENVVRRFYILGTLVFLLPFVNWATMAPFMFIDFSLIMGQMDLITIDSLINGSASLLITGLMLASFAHVLNEGLHIQKEHQLTV